MDVIDNIWVKGNYPESIFRQKALITIPDARYSANSIEIPKTSHDRADHIVEPGTEPPAGYNTSMDMRWAKIDLLARTRHFEELVDFFYRRVAALLLFPLRSGTTSLFSYISLDVVVDKAIFGHKNRSPFSWSTCQPKRRIHRAIPKRLNPKVRKAFLRHILFSLS